MLAGTGATAVDDGHAGKDEYGGKYLGKGELVHTEPNPYDAGDDGLQIVVHTHQSGSDTLLADRDEEICDEGGKEDEVGYLPPYLG